jgi:hypothetical protein
LVLEKVNKVAEHTLVSTEGDGFTESRRRQPARSAQGLLVVHGEVLAWNLFPANTAKRSFQRSNLA